MHWVITSAIVCVALITLSYYSPKIAFSLLGGLGVLLIALYYLNLDESESERFPISRSDILLTNTSTSKSYADSWDYSGRLANNSDKNVTDVEIRIKLLDCPKTAQYTSGDCIVIGDGVDFVAINIPTRQARDFRDNISFRNAKPNGKPMWEFELVGVRVSD